MPSGRVIIAVMCFVGLGSPNMLERNSMNSMSDEQTPRRGQSFTSVRTTPYAKETINPIRNDNGSREMQGRQQTYVPILKEMQAADKGLHQKLVAKDATGNGVISCPEVHELCEQHRNLLISWKCTCDADCQVYGSCCPDTPHDIRKSELINKECIDPRDTGPIGYYMISQCPDDWTNENTRDSCESKNTFQLDPISYIPVTSNVTNRTYRNIFCAVCHDDTNLVAWKIPENCKEPKNPFSYKMDCQRDFKSPEGMLVPPTCLVELIFSCSSQFVSEDVREKCFYYYEPVKQVEKDGTEHMYKNKYCSFCNGVGEDELDCPDLWKLSISLTTTYTPLAVLLDVDFSEGGTAVGKMIRCKPGYIFDPWMEECRSVYCGRLYEYRNGKCVKALSSESSQALLHNSTINSDCLKVSVDVNDYIILENGTLVLLVSGTILDPGEYETLQNDSILVCTQEANNYIEKFSDALNYVTFICISVSMICLSLKIILFFVLPESRTVPTLVVIFLSVSLFIAQLLFLAGSNQSGTALCVCIAVTLHYFILASVFWTNVLAFDVWRTFSTVKANTIGRKNGNLIYYTMYSWGTPLIIIFIASIMEWSLPRSRFSPEYGHHVCWISNRVSLLLFFASPLGMILMVNIILFTMTATKIAKTSKEAKFAHRNTEKRNRVRFALYIKLALVMGLTWLFGFASAYTDDTIMWYLFTIFNGLQGAYILLAFTHFRKSSLGTSGDNKSTSSGTKSSLTNSGNPH